MQKVIIRLINKWWVVIVSLILGGIFVYGYKEMFFHQDDLDWLIMANRPFWQVMSSPIGDHVNYIFRVLFKFEWEMFHLYFPGYLIVSLALHGIVVYYLYLLAKATSGRNDLAIYCALLFSVNTNWNEVVLWISGQTISITVLFVLLAMHAIWKKKDEVLFLLLACWTSALALGLPLATLLVYGFQKSKRYFGRIKLKTGWGTLVVLLSVMLIYYFLGTDGTRIEYGWKWLYQVIMVWGLAILNTVGGRLVIPFDRYETIRIVGVVFITIIALTKWRNKVIEIWKDQWSRFLILQLSFYYLIVAVGRAQYGIGIMRAERYGYLGLALILLLGARVLRNTTNVTWTWIIPTIVIIQCFGFYFRANTYVIRPQQMRTLFEEVRRTNPKYIKRDEYLPHFVLNDERLKYGDLMNLMKD